jgi:hypothetical protein
MRIRVLNNGRSSWGEVLVDATFAHEPILYYKDTLWSAEAALRGGLRFSCPTSRARGADAPGRRVWIFALVRAALAKQTHPGHVVRTAICRLLKGGQRDG